MLSEEHSEGREPGMYAFALLLRRFPLPRPWAAMVNKACVLPQGEWAPPHRFTLKVVTVSKMGEGRIRAELGGGICYFKLSISKIET